MERTQEKEDEEEELRITEIPAEDFHLRPASEKEEACGALLARLTATATAAKTPSSSSSSRGGAGSAEQTGVRMLSFSRQADALDFLDVAEKHRAQQDLPQLHLFSVETPCSAAARGEEEGGGGDTEAAAEGAGSTRHYVVCSYEAMWARHAATAPAARHLYEGIRDGAPCHMYFDIEFLYADWPGSDWDRGDRAVAAFEDAVRGAAELTYGHAVACVLDLDSSTATKFSRHVLVKLDGAVFADNAAVGSFVRAVLRAQAADAASPVYYESSAATGGVRRCMVDTAVYTRNRFMRMLGSCKWGRTAVFALLPRCRALYSSDRAAFLASLICNIGTDGIRAARLAAVMPALLPPVPDDRVPGLLADPSRDVSLEPGAALRSGSSSSGGSGTEYMPGSTPFPMLERFVEQHVCAQGGAHGTVRACRVNAAGTVATFSVSGNRFCECVGRQHRHNNVLVVCEVYNGVWYRRCLDPDCRAYCAPRHPIPAEFLMSRR